MGSQVQKEGLQGPMNQRPADEHEKQTSEGNTLIHPVQRSRHRKSHQLEGLQENIVKSIPKQEEEPILRSHGRNLSRNPTHSSSSNQWEQHDDWKSDKVVIFPVQRCFFACPKVNSLAIDGDCRQIHLPHAIFSHVQSLHRSHSTFSHVQTKRTFVFSCTKSADRLTERNHQKVHAKVESPSGEGGRIACRNFPQVKVYESVL